MAASGFHEVRQILQCWDKVRARLVKPGTILMIIKGLSQGKARNAGGVPVFL